MILLVWINDFQELELGLCKELWDSRQIWNCRQDWESLSRSAAWAYRGAPERQVFVSAALAPGVGFSKLSAMCIVVLGVITSVPQEYQTLIFLVQDTLPLNYSFIIILLLPSAPFFLLSSFHLSVSLSLNKCSLRWDGMEDDIIFNWIYMYLVITSRLSIMLERQPSEDMPSMKYTQTSEEKFPLYLNSVFKSFS